MYVTLWQNFRGHPKNVSFMQFSQKIDGFPTKRSTGLLELIQLYKQTPLAKLFIFTIYQNYTLALMLIIAAPRLWNELPLSIRTSPSLEVFKKNLKTYLMLQAYVDV